jgi:chromate transporter
VIIQAAIIEAAPAFAKAQRRRLLSSIDIQCIGAYFKHMNESEHSAEEQGIKRIPLREAFWTWSRVALLSFGGPAGQIAVMHRIIVEEKKWVGEERFLHALNYCMLLPGPEAQQLATYIGWLMHRTIGGLMAGLLFILPGVVTILGLSIAYAYYQQTDFLQAVFFGLKAAVLAIVIEAVQRIGKRVLKNRTMVAIAVASFIAIFFFNVPFPALIIAAAIIGIVGGRLSPSRFLVIRGHTAQNDRESVPLTAQRSLESQPLLIRSILVSVIFLTLWFGPLAAIWLTLGPSSVYFQVGVFFSQAAVVTFGGAYAVLAYIAQQAVERYAWLQPGEMLDGLGMAETTPGPLIMVVQFVGFMGAYRNPQPFDPLVGGIVGSLVTTWVTFVPCFFWIFLGAPFVERLRSNRALNSALSAITAAVVGAVLNLAVWFALHTLFDSVATTTILGITLEIPEFSKINLGACLVTIVAMLLTFYFKTGMAATLAVSTALGIALYTAAR